MHTNSWGNVGGIYGQLSMDVDKYLHQHEDFFVLFAGGNEGYSGLRSVIAPGNAKNCLTVGATQLRTVAQDEELDDPVRDRRETCLTAHINIIRQAAGQVRCLADIAFVWLLLLSPVPLLVCCIVFSLISNGHHI